jgi:hypothetical protein
MVYFGWKSCCLRKYVLGKVTIKHFCFMGRIIVISNNYLLFLCTLGHVQAITVVTQTLVLTRTTIILHLITLAGRFSLHFNFSH